MTERTAENRGKILGISATVFAVLFFGPGGLMVAAIAWTARIVQKTRQDLKDRTGENWEEKNSLGLPFTSRW